MLKNFRSYRLAVEFYRLCQTLKLPRALRDQLARASASVPLNLAEGAGRSSRDDRVRFYQIAFGSIRECQAILDLAPSKVVRVISAADCLAAHIYKLIQSC